MTTLLILPRSFRVSPLTTKQQPPASSTSQTDQFQFSYSASDMLNKKILFNAQGLEEEGAP